MVIIGVRRPPSRLNHQVVSLRYHLSMAMTLRLTDEEADALRAQAQREGRSMQEVARAAVRRYIADDAHRARVLDAATDGARRYAEALRVLGE